MKQQIYLVCLVMVISTACKSSRHTKVAGQKDTSIIEVPRTADAVRPGRDSLEYVKSILSNKEKYVNKEFGVLIKDLTMQIRSYTTNNLDRLSSSGIIISFDDWSTTRDKTENVKGAKDPVRMVVEWENPVSRADVEARLNRASGDWRKAEQDYYSKLVVKDIR